ncbi:YbfB/YjiJ family MFS transporter [Roseovarius spongiae]|nr:YbfB/YjiJ family MFS transporter [Roseovarius spongiae]
MRDLSDARDYYCNTPPALVLTYGISGIFVGIGLARFAYSPIIPLLIRDGWYSDYQAQLLGAWGLAGYLLGGFLAQRFARRFSPGGLSGAMGLLVLLSLLFCSFPIHFVHAAFWRTMSGVAGAVLMIAGLAAVNARLGAMGRQGLGGLVFTGVGAGALLGSIMMVFLPDASAAASSLGLTALCAAALAVNLFAGRRMRRAPKLRGVDAFPRAEARLHHALLLAIAGYALNAFGMTAHSLYVVDYVTREVGLAPRMGALIWTGFGIGAFLAPLVPLRFLRGGLVWICVAQGVAIAGVAVSNLPAVFWGATLIVGFGAPGVGMLVSAFIQRTIGPQSYIRYWALATTGFASAQAFGGFSASRLSQHWGGYQPVFLLGAGCLFAAALAMAGAARLRDRALAARDVAAG